MSEFMPENDVINKKNVNDEAVTDNGGLAAADVIPPPVKADNKKKKKSGAFGIFRAALYMLRKKPDEKEAAKKAEKERNKGSNGNWKMIVESMRPLHVQETPQSPMYQSPAKKDLFSLPPPSPMADDFFQPSSPAASSSCGTMSQYASAQNLRDLYNSDDEEGDPDEVFDALTGDEMIDAKAEEFIAQFYKQIQLQNTTDHDQDRGF